jgi:hypothetical protein
MYAGNDLPRSCGALAITEVAGRRKGAFGRAYASPSSTVAVLTGGIAAREELLEITGYAVVPPKGIRLTALAGEAIKPAWNNSLRVDLSK